MKKLTLQWQEANQKLIQHIYENQPSKNPGTCRLGRDPIKCDIVLTHPTVSGLHIEIFFDAQQQGFYIRNLRSKNPPLVDNKPLLTGEISLHENSIIFLGQQQINVTAISQIDIPDTIIIPKSQNSKLQPSPHSIPTQPNLEYGLECPNCHKISPPENLHIGCPWCGTSLAAAVSVLINN
ncbi:MAG: FHA domain-containing protein [Sphaerospermopsis sp. SIO1G2]|nr:FHA domain-containing protein [Sphaerospermopsis sp. SIO1G1]NET73590.1 FHA domain-containing protein [Sphaerospermopsis sp. SIO1G2]